MSANPKSEPNKARKVDRLAQGGLRWFQSLDFKLALVFVLVIAALSAGAFWAARVLVQDGLVEESARAQDSLARNHALQLDAIPQQAEKLASALPSVLPTGADNLGRWIEAQTIAPMLNSVGVWNADGTSVFYRVRRGATRQEPAPLNHLQAPWFGATRRTTHKGCIWSDITRDLAGNEQVLRCSYAQGGQVLTVSLSVTALEAELRRITDGNPGYLFALDQDLHWVLGNASGTLGEAARGKALSQLLSGQTALKPFVDDMSRRIEAARSSLARSAAFKAEDISALRAESPGLSRDAAEALMTRAWSQPGAFTAIPPEPFALSAEPISGRPAQLNGFVTKSGAWMWFRIAPEANDFGGVSYVVSQALAITLGLVSLTLLLVYLSLRVVVTRPLRTMASQLESSDTIEDAVSVVLDEGPRNEVGRLAFWQNERTRQLADALASARAARVQLSSESGERRSLQESLSKAEERLQYLLQVSHDALLICDSRGAIELMTPSAEALLGVSYRQARMRPMDEIVLLRDHPQALVLNYAAMAIERAERLEIRDTLELTTGLGKTLPMNLIVQPLVHRGQGVGAIVLLEDPNQRIAAAPVAAGGKEGRDSVTGLLQRAGCMERLDALLSRSPREGGVIVLDLDGLKRINEFGGLAAGDETLVRTGETLAGVAPNSRDVFRLSADQFAVVVEHGTAAEVGEVAETLRQQLAGTRFYWETRQYNITASLGFALLHEAISPMEALRRAEDACGAAKRAGRNAVVAYNAAADRLQQSTDDDTWLRCIRRGLEENLFHLRTQWVQSGPEFATEGHVFEALLALEDDEGFWASPASFMPTAERHQLMPEIDRWVIKSILDHLRQHPQIANGMAFVGLNISSHTLVDPDFLLFMMAQLEESPELAQKLCLEVDEAAITNHLHRALDSCATLHKLGVRFCVDHYHGRAMSDLSLLRRLPVDFVKVNTQAFRNLSSDPVEQMLVESTCRIARHLRRRVIVSGLEDLRAQETWRKLGAHYFQGFAFAKPSPVIFLPQE